jgi:hypothetical protein
MGSGSESGPARPPIALQLHAAGGVDQPVTRPTLTAAAIAAAAAAARGRCCCPASSSPGTLVAVQDLGGRLVLDGRTPRPLNLRYRR